MTDVPAKMRILRGEHNCSGGTCPTVYEAEDGEIYVQGFIATSEEVSRVNLPKGEALVRISRTLWESMSRG